MTNEFAQLKKNTVNAKGQLKDGKLVRFEHLDNDGVKILFVGNSITLIWNNRLRF